MTALSKIILEQNIVGKWICWLNQQIISAIQSLHRQRSGPPRSSQHRLNISRACLLGGPAEL